MVSSDANVDNNETGQNSVSRLFLYESEISSSRYIDQMVNGSILVDGYYADVFISTSGLPVKDIGNIGYDLFIDEKKTTNSTWALRAELKDHPVLFNGVECRLQFDAYEYANSDPNISRIYDAGTVYLFR
jgi:hypothetical protein